MSSQQTTTRRRPVALAAGVLGTAALVIATSGALSGFTASITNSVNTGGVGTLAMQETGPDGKGGTTTCSTQATATSATCATINKYGGDLTMNTTTNTSKTTSIQIKNTGSINATTFTLKPGACTLTANGNTGDLCSTALVTITQDGTVVADKVTPAQLLAHGDYTLATTNVTAGGTSQIDITFAIPATAPDAVQGQTVSQPLTWTFNA